MAELSATASTHEVIIEPNRGWFNLPWREFWEYRDLLVVLVQRDFTSRYKQTILGPLWYLLQPLLTTAIFVVVFGRVVGVSTDEIPAPLFYLCGLMAWNYFGQNVSSGATTFTSNAHLFGKVYFPRLIVPAGTVLSNTIAFALQIPLFFAIFAYYHYATPAGSQLHLGATVFLFPLLLVQIALLSFGVGLWLSSASAKYRDLAHLNAFIVQLWMFATPVIYPLSKVSDSSFYWLCWLNPMAPVVEACRVCLLGRGTIPPGSLTVSIIVTVLITLSGMALFHKSERTAMDSV